MKTDIVRTCRAPLLAIVLPFVGLSIVAPTRAAPVSFDVQKIARGWKLKSVSPQDTVGRDILHEAIQAREEDGWLTVSAMPATVHDILLDHGKIEFPWLPGRAGKCKWIAEQDWLYSVSFRAAHPQAASRLRLLGLDTIVDVYLNGQQIAANSNMYWPLSVDVTGRLREENNLILHFHTVFESSDGESCPIRRVDDDPLRRVRRPGQNYGNYLGPQPLFSRVGVYDQVLLEVTDGSCFASEDARIAAPVLHSLQRFMQPDHIWPSDYSPVYKHGDTLPYPETWLRYTTGSSWEKTRPVEQFYDATDAASLVHRLGMAESLYYQDTIVVLAARDTCLVATSKTKAGFDELLSS